MSIGDLMHPPERWDPTAQIAIIAGAATRWYAAHLLLFIGMLLFVPGLLALTNLAASKRPVAGYAARLLMLASVGALSAVFVSEMLLGYIFTVTSDEAAALGL